MFRSKKSSNRIELSRLVQDLLNFGVLGSLQLWGWGWVDWGGEWLGGGWMGVGGGWGGRWMGVGWLGGAPTQVHMHMHTRTHMHTHACVVNMIISCKWPPPLGVSLGIPYDVIRACACVRMHVCVCMCMCGGCTHSPLHTHIHPPAPPPTGGLPESVKIQ